MGEQMLLEIGRLSETSTTTIERTNVRFITGVNANVRAQIEIQGEPLATPLERTLERFFARMHKLMAT